MSSDSDEVPRKAAKVSRSPGSRVIFGLTRELAQTSKNEPIEVEDEDKPVLSRKAQRQNKRKGQEAALDESLAPASKATKTHNVSTQKPSGQQYGIWIGNLNFATDQDHLRDWLATGLLSEQGEISRIHMPAGTTHRNKNKGSVSFSFNRCYFPHG